MPFFETVAEALARGVVITRVPPPGELTRHVGVVTQVRRGDRKWSILISGGFGLICAHSEDHPWKFIPKKGAKVSFRIAWASGQRRAIDMQRES